MLLADSNMSVGTPVLEVTPSPIPMPVITPAPIGVESSGLPQEASQSATPVVSPIMPWWIIGIAVVVVIAGILLFRKYKK